MGRAVKAARTFKSIDPEPKSKLIKSLFPKYAREPTLF